jgi:ABC-type antimicrobial peptide transport system permease subunit
MTKRFAIGFGIGLLIFLTINLLAAHFASDCGLPAVFGRDACADDIARAGWPLQFYEEGGFAYRSNFNLLFLLINSTIGVVFSVIFGWIFARRKKLLLK